MATSFRPVIEVWGTSSSTFLAPQDLEFVLDQLIELSFAGQSESSDYDENRSIWIEQGHQLIDYIESKDVAFLVGLADGGTLDQSDLESLFTNIKALAPEWRTLIKEDGSLTFYIDQY